MKNNEQIENLISKYKFKEKWREKIDDWIQSFQSILNDLKDIPAISLADDEELQLLEEIKCPFKVASIKCETFIFQPPKVHLIGSHLFRCNVRKNNFFEIDLLLVIPSPCWRNKDHRDYIYHYKRSLYLAYISKHLKDSKEFISSVQFRYFNGDHLKPCLYVAPSGILARFCRFNILATASLGKSFIFKNFHPKKFNIQNVQLLQGSRIDSTPFYNCSILSDLSCLYFKQNLADSFVDSTNVQEALILMRIWLEKRNLRKQFAHIINVFTYDLLKKRILNPNLSSLQLFETILRHISNSDWRKKSPIVYFEKDGENSADLKHDLNGDFQVNLFTADLGLNICYDLTVGQYERLKFDAEHSVKFFDRKDFDLIQIFQTIVDFDSYFDFSINIMADCLNKHHLRSDSLYVQCGFNIIKAIVPEIHQWITLAASDRILFAQHKDFRCYDSWNLTSEPAKQIDLKNKSFITFGVFTIGENLMDVVTKGPQADQPDAKKFRDLWGEMSEIRRFQNGDIREAVFWKCDTVRERRKIIINVLKHVLNRKMKIKMNAISSSFDYLDDLLALKNVKFSEPTFHYGTGEDCLSLINHSMNILKNYLHKLELSFQLSDVVSGDPVSRHTEVFPQLPVNSKPKNVKYSCNTFDLNQIEEKLKYVRPIKLVVKIEANNKWSNDLEELKNRKYLICHELGKLLMKNYGLCVRIHIDYLDVYHDGFVFRIFLSLKKEMFIYRQLSSNTKAVKVVENLQADQIEFDTMVLPAISGCLAALNKKNVAFSLTCRLFKRWLSRQMIKPFFEEITMDLLVAYSFDYCCHAYPSSNSHLSAFIRLLDFLANFDFVENPVILNFNNSLSPERKMEIRQGFVLQRYNWPILFIVTPFDRKLSFHTKFTPNTQVVFHMKKLAKFTLENLRTTLASFKPPEIKTVMKPNMDIFDVIIKLDSKVLLTKHQSMDFPENIVIKHTLYSDKDKHAMPIIDYNPPYIYLATLKNAFKNLALFFYDEFGGLEIGVLFKPESLEQKPFKYSSIEASVLSSTSHSLNADNVRLNIEALVEDFKIIGQDLVESVVIKHENLLNFL